MPRLMARSTSTRSSGSARTASAEAASASGPGRRVDVVVEFARFGADAEDLQRQRVASAGDHDGHVPARHRRGRRASRRRERTRSATSYAVTSSWYLPGLPVLTLLRVPNVRALIAFHLGAVVVRFVELIAT